MARVKLSEYDAKKLLFPNQLIFPVNFSTTSSHIKKVVGDKNLVVKVDQGIKKRGKQGLVRVGIDSKTAVAVMREWGDQGFSRFMIEPMVEHDISEEKYLSLERKRDGWHILEGDHGGIDIEEHWDQVRIVDPKQYQDLTTKLDNLHITSLEINPLLVRGKDMLALDAACEIDSAAVGLAELAPYNLVPIESRTQTEAERAVEELDATTPASLKFRFVNPTGSLWMLLSGGGASLVLADEVADVGYGGELANYGEYSGAPTDDDTYSYAKIILKEMVKVKGKKKALIIAGGVANFTDVAKTFRGLIRAMKALQTKLVEGDVKVFVRRGGPNEKKGLAMMEQFLKEAKLLGIVHGHNVPLTQVVADAIKYLKEPHK